MLNLKFKLEGKKQKFMKVRAAAAPACVPGEGGWALKARLLTDTFLLESLISDLAQPPAN